MMASEGVAVPPKPALGWLAAGLALCFVYVAAAADPGGLTSAQSSFCVYALWMIPAASLWRAEGASRSGRERARRFAVTATVLLGVFACCVVASKLLFPRYPYAGPHELVVIALLAPAVLMSGWYLFGRLAPGQRRGALWLGWLLPAAALVSCTYYACSQPLRNLYPLTTTDLHYTSRYLAPDVVEYAAKGQVSPGDAERMMTALDLEPHAGKLSAPDVTLMVDWWRPPEAPEHFARSDWDGCKWTGLYAHGYLYLSLACTYL